jgi:hypothetical protein
MEIGNVSDVKTEITHSDPSATDVNSLVFLLISTLLLIPNGFPELAIGFAPVVLTTIMHQEKSAKSAVSRRS